MSRDRDGDGYLWDRSGEPDPEVVALEGELQRHRWQGRAAAAPLASITPTMLLRRAPVRVAAGLAAALLVVFLAREILRPAAKPVMHVDLDGVAGQYRVEVLAGAPTITGADADALLGPGASVVCDARDRVRVHVGDIGSVVVEADTRLHVQALSRAKAPDADYLLYLERGTLRASIFAAPRLFQVGTPAGLAVDLGCIYTATVDEHGRTLLGVLAGKVAFEASGRSVTVPSAASVVAWPGLGPGTPAWDRAPDAFREALAVLDRARLGALGGDPRSEAAALRRALTAVVSTDRPDDVLTLLHLLDHPDAEVAEAALAAMLALRPAPDGVTAEDLATDAGGARTLYWEGLPWS